MTLSTWLSVLEICRHATPLLSELEEESLRRFNQLYDPDMFSTDHEDEKDEDDDFDLKGKPRS